MFLRRDVFRLVFRFRALLFPLAVCLASPPARAQLVLNVNDTRDLEDFDSTDLKCDADPGVGGDQCTLRAALQNANWGLLGFNSFVVQLAPFTTYALDHWGTDDACRFGDLDVYAATLQRLEILGVAGTSTIDAAPLAAGGHPERVLHVVSTVSANLELVIRDLTIRGGRAGGGQGGGIRHTAGELELTDVDLVDNQAFQGGGIYVASELTMTRGVLLSNTTTANGDGGAAYVATSAPVTLANVIAQSNSADRFGGGLRIASGGAAQLTDCTVDSNSSDGGGGLSVSGTCTMTRGFLSANLALGGGNGGGAQVQIGGSLTLDGVHVTFNSADNAGGGVNVASPGHATLRECTVDANAASFGGGVGSSGDVFLDRSTVSRNTAGGPLGGGGVHILNGFAARNSTVSSNHALAGPGGGIAFTGIGPCQLESCTVAFNSSPGAGGVHSDAPVNTKSTIYANNRTAGGASLNFGGTVPMTSHGRNLDMDGTCLFATPTDRKGTLAWPLDPMLSPLQLNGGPTETHAIQLSCTAALDQGACDTIGGVALGVDQRGQPRFAPCDIGAYEAAAVLSGPTIAKYCFGDNSGTPCPCAPSAPADQSGCLHSFGVGGKLDTSGTSSMSAANLVLQASNLPPSTLVVFFQGTSKKNGGLGAVNGDGLTCVDGPLIRIATQAALGATSYPPAGGIPVHVKGLVTNVGAVTNYQAFFRNAAAYCSPATYNLTNGVNVRWCP